MVQNDPKVRFRVCKMNDPRSGGDPGFETREAAIRYALTLNELLWYEVYDVNINVTVALIQLGTVFEPSAVYPKKEEPPMPPRYKVRIEEVYLVRRYVDFEVEANGPEVFTEPDWRERPEVKICAPQVGELHSEEYEYVDEFVRGVAVVGTDQWYPLNLPAGFGNGDIRTLLEIARLGIAMVGDEIAEELDLSDDELVRLRDLLHGVLGEPPRRKGDTDDSPWLRQWEKEGDDMPCPQCTRRQIETQDGVTLCHGCGWQEKNPLNATAGVTDQEGLDERDSLRTWVKELAGHHSLDEGQEVVIFVFWDDGYSLELESDHATIAGVWACNTEDEITANQFADQLEEVLVELGYKVLPLWLEEDDENDENDE